MSRPMIPTEPLAPDLRRELLGFAGDLRALQEQLDRITDRVGALIERAGDAPRLWAPPPGFTLEPDGQPVEEPREEASA